MKFLHISDLHIGKKVNGFSLIKDQEHILDDILRVAQKEKVNGIIIAGDVYDTYVPPVEAVRVFDRFICEIHKLKISCFIVSGNHDNISRVSFGSGILAHENIFIAPKYDGKLTPISVNNEVDILLLPFIRPVDVRRFHPDFEIGNYDEMMRTVLNGIKINKEKINILVAHQFITFNGNSPQKSESESTTLGSLGNIDASNFSDFDYVALGHIHKPQVMGLKSVRYSGSPLKYSFSEKNDTKAMVILNIKSKKITQKLIPFAPIRDMKEFVGTFEEIMREESCEDYLRIVLRDESFIPDIKKKLETKFPNIMEIIYDNKYTRENVELNEIHNITTKTPQELFGDFYESQNNSKMSPEQEQIVDSVFKELNSSEEDNR